MKSRKSDITVKTVHGLHPDILMAIKTQKPPDVTTKDFVSDAIEELIAEIGPRNYILHSQASYRGSAKISVRIRHELNKRFEDALSQTKTRTSTFIRAALFLHINNN